jgi:hypothetical protein
MRPLTMARQDNTSLTVGDMGARVVAALERGYVPSASAEISQLPGAQHCFKDDAG